MRPLGPAQLAYVMSPIPRPPTRRRCQLYPELTLTLIETLPLTRLCQLYPELSAEKDSKKYKEGLKKFEVLTLPYPSPLTPTPYPLPPTPTPYP